MVRIERNILLDWTNSTVISTDGAGVWNYSKLEKFHFSPGSSTCFMKLTKDVTVLKFELISVTLLVLFWCQISHFTKKNEWNRIHWLISSCNFLNVNECIHIFHCLMVSEWCPFYLAQVSSKVKKIYWNYIIIEVIPN